MLFAGRAVEALRQSSPSGLDAALLTRHPDFGALRQRDDFKKLLAEIQEKEKQRCE